MADLLKPCLVCDELSEQSRCEEHRLKNGKKKSATKRGYDFAWERLSKRARRLQPFCSWCYSTEDLTTDHSPEAWDRMERGLPIRLSDVDVLCRSCNAKKGAAR